MGFDGLCLASLGFFTFRRVAARAFSSIVGDVPARAFELNRRSPEQTVYLAAALGAFFQVRPGKILNFFRSLAALPAFVLVQGHRQILLEGKTKKYLNNTNTTCGPRIVSAM